MRFKASGEFTQRFAAYEVFFTRIYGKAESGLKGIVFRRDIAAPVEVPLFNAQAVQGLVSHGTQAVGCAGLHEGIPDGKGAVGGDVQLPTELAGIAYALGPHFRIPDGNGFSRHITELPVGKIVTGHLAQNGPSPGSPQADTR